MEPKSFSSRISFVILLTLYLSVLSFWLSRSTNYYPSEIKQSSSISSKPVETDRIYRQLWLIRHGERMDAVRTIQSKVWRNNTSQKRLFDAPLTQIGIKQATERGNLLLQQLKEIKQSEYPKYIYSSPTQRTIGTAIQIASILKLPIKIIPGLASCAAAVKSGGLIIKKMKRSKYDKHYHRELYLRKCGFISSTYLENCNFLTKHQMIKKFGKNDVNILFDYKYIDQFAKSVQRLTNDSESNIILAVTHREGIKYLDDILNSTHIPYCKVAKYEYVPGLEEYPNQFRYFEDDDNLEVSQQVFHSPFVNKVVDTKNVDKRNYLEIENEKLKKEIQRLKHQLSMFEDKNKF